MEKVFSALQELLAYDYEQYFDDEIEGIILPDTVQCVSLISVEVDKQVIAKYIVNIGNDIKDLEVTTEIGDQIMAQMFSDFESALFKDYGSPENPDREYDAWKDEQGEKWL